MSNCNSQIPYKPWVPPTSDCQSFDPAKLWPELVPGNAPSQLENTSKDGLMPAKTIMQTTAVKSEGTMTFSKNTFLSLVLLASCFGIGFALVV